MNLGGHVVVAAALSDDPAVHLGAALPDVATIGGFRMVGGAGRGAVGRGIVFHHATDAVFHGHAWFTSLMRLVIDSSTAAGVGRGAARASAHVGVELLLDGMLFAGAAGEGRAEIVSTAFGHATHAEGMSDLVAGDARHDWMAHVAGLSLWRTPSYFNDPYQVAHRLQALLDRRPRLAMTAHDVAKVGSALAEVHPTITETADDFVADLIQRLGSDRALR